MSTTESPAVLFIGGTPRSGTTLLTDLLNEAPDVAIMAEYRFSELFDHLGPLLDYEKDYIARDEMAPRSPAPRTKRQQKAVGSATATKTEGAPSTYLYLTTEGLTYPLRFPTAKRLPEIASAVVRASLNKPSARVLGSKTPGAMLAACTEDVKRISSKVRYIALLRSPKSQVNSSLNRRNLASGGMDDWPCRTVEDAIAEYVFTVAGLLALRERVGDDLMFVKYEDLIENPSEVMSAVAEHIGLKSLPVSEKLVHRKPASHDILTDDEREKVQDTFQDVIRVWASLQITGTQPDLPVFDESFPSVPRRRRSISIDNPANFLVGGWSTYEQDGIWSDGPEAAMLFGPAPAAPMFVRLEVTPFFGTENPIGLEFSLNGEKVDNLWLFPGEGVAGPLRSRAVAIGDRGKPSALWLGPVQFRSDAANLLKIRFENIVSPASADLSGDTRKLAVKLSALHATPAGDHKPNGSRGRGRRRKPREADGLGRSQRHD